MNLKDMQEFKRIIWHILYMPFVLSIALFIVLLRPFVILRLVPIFNTRFGHFVGNVEMYLLTRDAGMYPKNSFDVLFYFNRPTCNKYLKTMWKRIFNEYKLLVFPEIFAGLFRRTNVLLSKFPAMAKHVVVDNDQDVHHLMRKGKVHLVFTEEEEERGRKALKSFGIPENTPFLCILAREDAYDKTAHPEFYQSNSSTHNCDIVNFMDAAAEMARRGYYVFRMGSVVQKPIPKLDNPMIIDYPFTGKRSEFMDIYLWARCRFAISADSGPVSIPVFSKVPVVIVNKLPLATMFWWDHNILYIPKKLFIKRINRHTTFPEQIFFEASWFENGARTPFQYHVSGLEMEECTPGEIFDVAVEMDDRLKGVHIANPEDEKLQAQFWNLFPPSLDPVRFVDIRIGSKYLRDNRERLGSGFNK